MQLTFIFLYSLLTCIFVINPLIAIAPQDKQDVKNDLRILELLPNLLCPLVVDPGIPADFVALSPNGILDPYDFIYWGSKNVLIAYFKNPSFLKVPLIRVKLSEMVAQRGSNSFHPTFRRLQQHLINFI